MSEVVITEMSLPDRFDLVAHLVPGGVLWSALLSAGWLPPNPERKTAEGLISSIESLDPALDEFLGQFNGPVRLTIEPLEVGG